MSTPRFGFARSVVRALDGMPLWIPELAFRIALAIVFWRSGQAKLASWETTLVVFAEEYRVPLLPPTLAAYLSVVIETAGSVALILGLGTRIAAAAMLGMTLVIQLFIYPASYPDHLLWAGPLLYLLFRGPGRLSFDHLIRMRFDRSRPVTEGDGLKPGR